MNFIITSLAFFVVANLLVHFISFNRRMKIVLFVLSIPVALTIGYYLTY